MWTARLVTDTDKIKLSSDFTTGSDYMVYDGDIEVSSPLIINGINIVSSKKIPYRLPKVTKISDTKFHVTINESVPDGAIVTMAIDTNIEDIDKGTYSLVTSFPSCLKLEPEWTSNNAAYTGLLSCIRSNYAITNLTGTINDIEDDSFIHDNGNGTYTITISNWKKNSVYKITANASKVSKTFILTLSLSNMTSDFTSGEYQSADFYIIPREGYRKSDIELTINNEKCDALIEETDTGYHIVIAEDNFNDNDFIKVTARGKLITNYYLESSISGLTFIPNITSPLIDGYEGKCLPPEGYHFTSFSISADNGEGQASYSQNSDGYNISLKAIDGVTYTITGRLEKNVDNGDKYAFIRVYNPDNIQLDQLSKKRYRDKNTSTTDKPEYIDIAEYIIDLFRIFVDVPQEANKNNMLLANYDTGIAVNQLHTYDIKVDCGTVSIREQFKSIADYKLTECEFYIPFVGYQVIDSALIMEHDIAIRYYISVVSGNFIVKLYDEAENVVAMFKGNMSVHIPYTTDNKYVINLHSNITDNDLSLIDLTPYVTIRYHDINNSPYTKTINTYTKLNDVTGFTIIDNIEFNYDDSSNILYSEELELKGLLQEGVIL